MTQRRRSADPSAARNERLPLQPRTRLPISGLRALRMQRSREASRWTRPGSTRSGSFLLQQEREGPGRLLRDDVVFLAADGPGHAHAADDALAILQRASPHEEEGPGHVRELTEIFLPLLDVLEKLPCGGPEIDGRPGFLPRPFDELFGAVVRAAGPGGSPPDPRRPPPRRTPCPSRPSGPPGRWRGPLPSRSNVAARSAAACAAGWPAAWARR